MNRMQLSNLIKKIKDYKNHKKSLVIGNFSICTHITTHKKDLQNICLRCHIAALKIALDLQAHFISLTGISFLILNALALSQNQLK